MSSHSQLPS